MLALRDALAGGPRQARFLLAPLAPGESEQAAYRLPTDRRGVFAIGPLEAERSDPFGLARRSSAIAAITELTVYPRIDPVRPLPDSPGRRPRTTPPPGRRRGPHRGGLLRPAALQRATTCAGCTGPRPPAGTSCMIRQDEVPWQGRATVVLDIRARVHTDGLPRGGGVGGGQRGHRLLAARLAGAAGHHRRRRLGFGSGAGHLEAVLARLAVLQPSGDGKPSSERSGARGLDSLGPHRPVDGAVAVVTTTSIESADLDRLARLARMPSAVTLVSFAGRRPLADGARWPAVGHVVSVAANQSFADVWDTTLSAGGRGLRRPAATPAGPR